MKTTFCRPIISEIGEGCIAQNLTKKSPNRHRQSAGNTSLTTYDLAKEKKGLPELETGNPDLKRVVSKLPRRTHRAFQHPVRLIVAREHLFYGIPLE